MLVTALSPVIGYDKASKIAHYAMDNDLTLRAAALKQFANPATKPKEETEVQSGSLNNGANAVTAIAIPFGSAKEIGFACDNGRQGLPTAKLRVAVWNGHWTVHDSLTVDSTKGQTVL